MPSARRFTVAAALIAGFLAPAAGQSAFEDAGAFPFPSWTQWAWTVADVTQDGRADVIALPIQSTLGVPVLIAGIPPAYTTYPHPFPGLTQAHAVAAGDVDNDGLDDVVISDGAIRTCLALPGGTFQAAIVSGAALLFDIKLVDWDGDGNLDLTGADANAVRIRLGAGNGTFPIAIDIAAPFLARFRTGDMDQDGDPDLLLLLADTTFAIHKNHGAGGFGAALAPAGLLPFSGTFDVGDVDGDGWPDLVHCFPILSAAFTGVAFNDHTGGFVPGPLTWGGNLGCLPRTTDLDQDGRADVVGWMNIITSPSVPPASIVVHAYGSPNGISPPGPARDIPFPTLFWQMGIGDADADGDEDLFPIAPGGGRVLLNLIAGSHSGKAGPYFGGCQPQGPRLSFTGSTAPGAAFALVVAGAPPLAPAFFLAGSVPAQIPVNVPGCILAVGDPLPFAAPLLIDGAGGATLPFSIPPATALSGVRACGQVIAFSATAAGGLAGTNGLLLVF